MTPDRYLDALLGLPRISAAQVSPDGRWVAWTWSNTGPAADVFAAPTDGSSAPIGLTETPHDTILTSWTPDSRAVLVAQDRDGARRPKTSTGALSMAWRFRAGCIALPARHGAPSSTSTAARRATAGIALTRRSS